MPGKQRSCSSAPDGGCLRDYARVTDLMRAPGVALRHLRDDGAN